MKHISFYTILFFIISQFTAQSQSVVKTKDTLESYVRLQYENDYFSATDGYFTQGIQLTLIQNKIKYSPFRYALIGLKNNTGKYYGLHLEQDCFTPISIRFTSLNEKERNYAAIFYLSHSLTSLNSVKKISFQTQLDLGIIGPCAKCEEVQKGIHKATFNLQPIGWENQLKTDYIINYRAKVEEGIYNKKHREIIANATARVGSLYTDISVGMTARIGKFNGYFNNLGMDSKYKISKKNFQFYGILKVNAKAVAYNATMQGGLFNQNSIYTISDTRINRFVLDALTGIVLTYKRTSLEYSKIYQTKEFAEGLSHGWGKCVITYSF